MDSIGTATLAENSSTIVADGDWTLEHLPALSVLCQSLSRRITGQDNIPAVASGRID